MVKKEVYEQNIDIIPAIGMKQGSWYFPLKFLFSTVCATIIILAITAMIDLLEITGAMKTIMMTVVVLIILGYVVAIVKLFIDWCKNTKAITDQEIAKSQILYLEVYNRARQYKPGEALYDETEWVHDISANLRKEKSKFMKKEE